MPFYIGVPQIDNGKLRINWMRPTTLRRATFATP